MITITIEIEMVLTLAEKAKRIKFYDLGNALAAFLFEAWSRAEPGKEPVGITVSSTDPEVQSLEGSSYDRLLMGPRWEVNAPQGVLTDYAAYLYAKRTAAVTWETLCKNYRESRITDPLRDVRPVTDDMYDQVGDDLGRCRQGTQEERDALEKEFLGMGEEFLRQACQASLDWLTHPEKNLLFRKLKVKFFNLW